MKPKTIDCVTIDSDHDGSGYGWYVGLKVRNNGSPATWLEAADARRLARLILKAATKPKGKRK